MTPTSTRTSNGQLLQNQQQQQRGDASIYVDLKSPPLASTLAAGTRASVVRAEWFWASIQMCCRASEVLYEFNSATSCGGSGGATSSNSQSQLNGGGESSSTQIVINQANPPATKRMKLSRENLLADNNADHSPRLGGVSTAISSTRVHMDSPDIAASNLTHLHPKKKSANNLIATNLGKFLQEF